MADDGIEALREEANRLVRSIEEKTGAAYLDLLKLGELLESTRGPGVVNYGKVVDFTNVGPSGKYILAACQFAKTHHHTSLRSVAGALSLAGTAWRVPRTINQNNGEDQ